MQIEDILENFQIVRHVKHFNLSVKATQILWQQCYSYIFFVSLGSKFKFNFHFFPIKKSIDRGHPFSVHAKSSE